MSSIWVILLLSGVFAGIITGNVSSLGLAALEGAPAAVDFCLRIGGLIALWSGVLEIMRRSGLMASLSKALRPVLSLLFPRAAKDKDTMQALASNVSANLLGLGNAATPMGIRAASGMARLGDSRTASPELCLLVVINTASIQLLPTTIASVRAAEGAASPFDILPAVWISSIFSVTVGIIAAKLLERVWPH